MTSSFQPVDARVHFPQIEEEILCFWKENDCFRKSLENRDVSNQFTFYDGPPFATGLPHYGHILAGTLKDLIPRYQTMLGKYVPRRFGWDCHGVPVEHEMEKQLGFKNREDIEKYGIQNFCESCRGIVQKYTGEWEQTVERMGRWVDFKNSYRTMDPQYMESILWVFSELWKKGFIYEGKKVVSYSPKLASTLSNFEANLNYKDIDDPAVTVKFELADKPGTYVLAWTTTPWTLPSNLALCVNPDIEYVKVEYENKSGENKHYILAKSIFEKKKNELFPSAKDLQSNESLSTLPKIIQIYHGSDLVGKTYTPLFSFFADHKNAFQILGNDFVSDADGTGIVHLAPAFGEEDSRVCRAHSIEPIDPIDKNGYFDDSIPEFSGLYFRKDETVADSIKDNVNKRVVQKLEDEGKLFKQEWIRHSYPFCWRTDCALMYRGIHTFFVDIQKIKKQLIESNRDISWVPSHLRDGRFGKLLEGAPDWAISRSRYWGAPIPVWKCEKCNHREVVGSVEEIGKKAKKTGKIFVVRHGEGTHNVENILSTQIDDRVSLTQLGVKQSQEIGSLLKEKGIDVIYCSPLLRTRQTAQHIADSAGVDVEIISDERIKEIDAGKLDSKPIPEWKASFDAGPRFHQNPHEGESEADVEKRTLEFLQEVEKTHGDKNVLIVTHGAVLRLIVKYFRNLAEEAVFGLRLPPGTLLEYSFSQLPTNDFGELDLHRPYIDNILIKCPECSTDMHRVPEVLDCWFESGSMPYAQNHFPFEEGQSAESMVGFPADFIAEGLDQTRGWFYTLHVLGNILFDSPAFKNVIVNGIVLAEDGQKMSKSKKNYPDPQVIFDKYGADAMRFYLMHSQVVKADDLRFTEEGVSEVMRRVFLPLWNAYSFFVTYANIDQWEKGEWKGLQTCLNNKLDKWIITEMRTLIQNFRSNMDSYEIDAACRLVPEFLDKLTNFYIRRSRRRFWKSEVDTDKNEAFLTLYTVIKTVSQIIAPISPFLPEKIWQNLRRSSDPESIHLTDFPDFQSFYANPNLLTEISAVRTIISLALTIRAKEKIKVRQPLSKVKVALPPRISQEMILENLDIITEEINVKELEIVENPDELSEVVAKPDARKLGPKFGREIQDIIREAKSGNFVKNENGTVTVAGKWKLETDEIEIGFIGKAGLDVESDKGIVVALDPMITPALKAEGVAREIIRHIQELRKKADYDISDRIIISITGADEVVQQFHTLIKNEVLASDILTSCTNPDEISEVEIDGIQVVLEVMKEE